MRSLFKWVICIFIMCVFSFSTVYCTESMDKQKFLVNLNSKDHYISFGDCANLERVFQISATSPFYGIYQIKDMLHSSQNKIIAYSSIKLYTIDSGQPSIINLEDFFSPLGIMIDNLSLIKDNVYISLYITSEEDEKYILLKISEFENDFNKEDLKKKRSWDHILFYDKDIYFFKEIKNYIALYKGLDEKFIGYIQCNSYFKPSLIESIDIKSKDSLLIKTINYKNYFVNLRDGSVIFSE